MSVAILAGIAGFVLLSVVVGDRWLAARRWQSHLTAYRFVPPRGLTSGQLTAWLDMLASASRHRPVGLEIRADNRGIAFFLLISAGQTELLAQLRAGLPGVRIDEAPDYLTDRPDLTAACELRLTNLAQPLAHERAETTVTALLSGLYPLRGRESIRLQWLLSGARAVALRRDAEDQALVQALRQKQTGSLFDAVGRIGVSASQPERAGHLLNQLTNALSTLDAPGVAVVRRQLSSRLVIRRLYQRALPLTTWPLRLNTSEAAGLLGLPTGTQQLPGLDLGRARQLPPPRDTARSGVVLAESNFPGFQNRPLALKTTDRLRHTYLVGPTGGGKSTLIANQALQDIARGDGLILVDAKADLVNEVLRRVPEDRTDDVIVLDPSRTDRPIGFNLLQAGNSEHDRELVVDQVVNTFSELWRSSWGPRTSETLRSTLLTLIHTTAPHGSAFTLVEAAELLTNPVFRRSVLSQPTVPAMLRPFWYGYDQLTDAERWKIIGPSLNKLRQFSTRTALRLMLGQSDGIDIGQIFHQRKILLVPLSAGIIGSDTAQLLGSLLVAGLAQATRARAAVLPDKRRPTWAYLDEFQEILRLGSDRQLADMLAQARGYGLGLILANQFLDQLTEPVLRAIFGTVRSQIVFQCDYDDARILERRFAPSLTAADLMGLDAYEVAIRPCIDGSTRLPTTGKTLPLSEPLREAEELAALSRQQYGRPRREVEAQLQARIAVDTAQRPIGRSRKAGTS
ncbi:type IV secretory system conjugative DNA transfer family protein [Fodinicola acaciae]|uniref:type IV secretory system conjugative DNA transfer family protein n=1 Tax=Fodinicola acaciae TaxID=2681555 RepID=UPI0013D5F694|nr:type IV secretion system DNA-binding domain-containing protein [Fodinicola acaciae]